MAAFQLSLEWWQVIGFSVLWWVSLMGSYAYGYANAKSRKRPRSRNRSQPSLFDDAAFTNLAAPTPELPPPPPRPAPELTPWIAYDDGSWQRLCPARCHKGMLYNPYRHCGACDGEGYQIVWEDPLTSEMLPSPLEPPELTTDEPSEVSAIPWPPTA